MNILIVGSGGREHALAWKISQSETVERLICAPGNPGIARHAQCVPVKADDVKALVRLAEEQAIDLVVVGPEAPLAGGLVDRLTEKGIAAFGPTEAAAQLESSKAFTKAFCERHGIPTARHRTVDNMDDARAFLDTLEAPFVLKADGLAAGKGVIIAETRKEAEDEAEAMLSGKFGDASATLVIEEFLKGEEASVFALSDGKTAVVMKAAQDHKRIGEGDTGLNTGGMGAYSPTPAVDQAMLDRVMADIINPTVKGMAEEGAHYQGVLYAGLMLTREGPKLIEYNARFGDPECQVLMMRMKSDLVPALKACADGALADLPVLDWDARPAVCLVMAAPGYPEKAEKGSIIRGVDSADDIEGVEIFHAGTAENDKGELMAAGGRVLNVTASGDTLRHAVERAYAAANRIDWPEAYYRKDIAWRALRPSN